jgi:hypothetical protein
VTLNLGIIGSEGFSSFTKEAVKFMDEMFLSWVAEGNCYVEEEGGDSMLHGKKSEVIQHHTDQMCVKKRKEKKRKKPLRNFAESGLHSKNRRVR